MSTVDRPGGRILVTGLGIVAPTGPTVEDHWQAVLAGKSGLGRITAFDPTGYPVTVAGEVAGFEARGRVPGRVVPQTDRWTHLALVATDAALADAGADPAELDEYEMAVVTSSSSGGTAFGQNEMENLYRQGPSWVGAYQSIAWFYAATTGQISIRHGMRGPCGVVCAEQAGGLDAIAQARRLLRTGSRLVVTGGTDSSLCPYGVVAQLADGRLSSLDDPARAYTPFATDAPGHVPGEGGAILVTETEESARARGRTRSWGAVEGWAAGFDPYDDAARTEGRTEAPNRPPVLAGVIRRALADAGLAPGDVDVVFADGAGTPERDADEARALAEVFGPRGVPVTAPKSLTGRLYGGGAPLDVATALLALRDGIVPHTAGTARPDPDYALDLVVDRPRELPLRHALVVARGHGGFVSALVVGSA
ncbi:ketosynthase chain-length factor [Streptomyces hydrogenans]|uniref:ketosynthase chain-length factor n=1 Tax=Streptomyces hydrogenans TaxID=1873719 RepID=UPI0036EF3EFF